MKIHFTDTGSGIVNIRPQSLEAERALIGVLLLDHQRLGEVLERISDEDFIHPWHKKLFKGICASFVNYKAADIPILSEILSADEDELKAIYKLVSTCVSSANILSYADIIKQKSVQRKLIEVSDKVFQNKNDNLSIDTAKIAKFEKKLSNVKSRPCKSPLDCLAMFFEETAAEIRLIEQKTVADTRSIEMKKCFIMSLIAEVVKAMVRTQDEIEQQEDRDNAS